MQGIGEETPTLPSLEEAYTLWPLVSTEGLVLLCVDDRPGCIRPAQESMCCVPDSDYLIISLGLLRLPG